VQVRKRESAGGRATEKDRETEKESETECENERRRERAGERERERETEHERVRARAWEKEREREKKRERDSETKRKTDVEQGTENSRAPIEVAVTTHVSSRHRCNQHTTRCQIHKNRSTKSTRQKQSVAKRVTHTHTRVRFEKLRAARVSCSIQCVLV